MVFIYDLQFLAVQLEVCAEGEAATFAENDHLGLFGVNNEVISHRVSSQPPEEEVELHRGGRKECKVVRVQETVDVGGVRETPCRLGSVARRKSSMSCMKREKSRGLRVSPWRTPLRIGMEGVAPWG